jgi:hypothetical protein
LIVALLASALRALVPDLPAALALAVWTLGTAVLPVLSQALWQHTGAALGAAIAIRALAIPLRNGDRAGSRALALGLGAGLVVACRPPDLPIALALLFAFALTEWRSPDRSANFIRAALATLLPLAIHFAYQWQAFGSPLRSGYGDEALHGWTLAGAPVGLAGLLFSPGRGLLLWSPVLLVALLPLVRSPRANVPKSAALHFSPAMLPLALGLLAQLLLISCWWAWHGGSSFGPRMLAGSLPLYAPLLALAFAQMNGKRSIAITAALALFSIVPNALVTYIPLHGDRAEAIIHLRTRSGAWSGLSHPLSLLLRP